MSMNSMILAIGPFSKDIAKYLVYPEDYYSDTKEGTLVNAEFFNCVSTTQSCELAEALGITDPYDFNQYHIQTKRQINKLKLRELFIWDWEEDYKGLVKLLKKGFTLLYCPNY